MRIQLLVCLLITVAASAFAQPGNDQCVSAIALGEISTYCSGSGEFSNEGATNSGDNSLAGCFFDDSGLDVWFSFITTATDLNIRVVGSLPRNSGGTLVQPEFALYSSCDLSTEIGCASDAFGVNVAETFVDDVLPGNLYFLRVQAREANMGSFQLCLDMFDFVPEPQSDCVDGVILCDKSSFTISNLLGAGDDTSEINESDCIREEFSSVWYRWTCDVPGTLGFTLTPNNPIDDLDFALFELPGGIDDCAGKQTLRCMASGANVRDALETWERCSGQTGLRVGEPDQVELPGCDPGDNNYADGITMVAGRSYALIINNFTNTGNGFSITWNGTGTFVGPSPSFTIDPLSGSQCDDDPINFTNTSSLTPGSTGSYEWFFGNYSSPTQAGGPGPHAVNYDGFGDKTITLRVTSSEGCVVTETREIFIEACCEASEPLIVDEPTPINPACPGTASGGLSLAVLSGVPDFFFSLNGGPYLAGQAYEGLFAGDYTVFAQNIKGCLDTVDVALIDPPALTIEIGEDLSIELGETVDIMSVIDQPGDFDYVWTGGDSIICLDGPCSEVEVLTGNPTQIMVSATSPAGCVTTDLLQIDVRKVRPLFVPNAISPNLDGSNDGWTLFGPSEVVLRINEMHIFDRWGNQVFETSDIPLNRPDLGWQGTADGRQLNPGVFAFYAEVLYIDGVALPVTGDITLLR